MTPNDYISGTPKRIKFEILSASGDIVCDKEPIGWKEGKQKINRDLKTAKITSVFEVNELTFIGNAAVLLKTLFDAKEIMAEATLKISYLSGMDYVEFPARYIFDFKTYKVNKITEASFGVTISLFGSSLETKFENRRSNSINLLRESSVGGLSLGKIYTTDESNFKMNILAFGFGSYGMFYKDNTNLELEYDILNTTYSSIPLNNQGSVYTDLQDVPNEQLKLTKAEITPLLLNSSSNVQVSVGYDLNFRVDSTVPFAGHIQVWKIYIETYDGTGATVFLHNIGNFGETDGYYNFNGSEDVTLSAGDSMRIYVQSTAFDEDSTPYYGECTVNLITEAAITSDKARYGMTVFNAFKRLSQMILDQQYAFYSPFFGLLGDVYNADLDEYLSEDDESFAMIFRGKNLRGKGLLSDSFTFPLSFDELFESVSSLWGLGCNIESVGDDTMLVVDKYENFFDNTEILDISDRITIYDIETEYINDFAFSELKNGFANYSVEDDGGMGEYCTNVVRSTILNTTNKQTIQTSIRGDQTSMVRLLDNDILETGAVDLDGDNDFFIIKAQRVSVPIVSDWQSERDEIISVVDNTSMYGSYSINLYFTPARSLFRNYCSVLPALMKETGSYYDFQDSGKQITLKTTDGTTEIKETEDILVSKVVTAMGNPLFRPIKHTVQCKINNTEWSAILDNPKGYITFTSTISGYLLSAERGNLKDDVTLVIVEKL